MSAAPRIGHEFSGLVLAGGRSTRMGRDKAFLRIEGTRLIDRQLALLRALGAQEGIVSGRRGVNYRVRPARVVLDCAPGSGPAAGILTGLQACHSPFLFVLAVDLPKISLPFAVQLVQRVTGACGVVPRNSRGYEPLAAIYPRALSALWAPMLAAGECSLQALVRAAVAAGQLSVWDLTEDEAGALANWNSPGDWSPSAGAPDAKLRPYPRSSCSPA